MPYRTILFTTTTVWAVPTDWDNSNNIIEAIAGGQGGGWGWGNGGGAGAYSYLQNVTLTPGTVISMVVGQGGQGKTVAASGSDFGNPGSATSFNNGQILADYGGHALSDGGYSENCVGIATSGGTGGTNSSFHAGGGGGGASGPNGQGGDGGALFGSNYGNGGGGADGGGAGGPGGGGAGGQGGAAQNGTPGGAGGVSGSINGAAGVSGSGGGGGYIINGAGGAGSTAPSYAGSGGGSGGGGPSDVWGPGGNGGLYGAGGGAGLPGGAGAGGVLIVTYFQPATPQPPQPWTGLPPYLREMTYRQRLLGQSFDPTVVIRKPRPGPLRIIEIDGWMN